MSHGFPVRGSDRDGDRDKYLVSSSSSYSPQLREDNDDRDYEPGQISGSGSGRREWEVEWDPRFPPPIEYSQFNRSPRVSERGRDRERVEVVIDALRVFSRTMHSTLLSTSKHALALQYLKRMESFHLPPSGIPNPSLADAQNRLGAAEVELSDMMRALYTTFEELMKRHSSQARDRSRARDSESGSVWDKEKEREKELSKSDVEGVRNRMKALERRLDEFPPPPPPTTTASSRKGKEKEPSEADGDGTGIEGKRSRAKHLLEEMLSRLQAVEGLKENLDTRCNDLEDLVYSRIQDDLEVVKLGNGRWKDFEDMRDPDGSIRGIKRKRGEGTSPLEDVPPPPPVEDNALSAMDTDVHADTHSDELNPAIVALQVQMASLQSDRNEIKQLRAQIESLRIALNTNSIINNAQQLAPPPQVTALQKQVEQLEIELRECKDLQLKQATKELADTKALDELKMHCEAFVKASILQTVNKMADTASRTSNAKVSPSFEIPPKRPSISSHQHQQQDKEQQHSQTPRQQQGDTQRGSKRERPFDLRLPLPLPTARAYMSNPSSITQLPHAQPQAQAQSHPQPRPRPETQDPADPARAQAEKIPTHTGRAATDTPAMVSVDLALEQVPRPASSDASARMPSIQHQYQQQSKQQAISSEQRQGGFQFDRAANTQLPQVQPPSLTFHQESSASDSTQFPQNPPRIGSSLLAEWVDQRSKHSHSHSPSQHQLKHSTQQAPPPNHQHWYEHQHQSPHTTPLPPQSSSNPLIQGPPQQAPIVQTQPRSPDEK